MTAALVQPRTVEEVILETLEKNGALTDTGVFAAADQEFLSLTIMTLLHLEQREMVISVPRQDEHQKVMAYRITDKGRGFLDASRSEAERRAALTEGGANCS